MRHLLVVDDDTVFRDMLVKALKNQGYRAMGINNPDTLASTIAIHQPDVVLLNMRFENGTDGFEICRMLRSWSAIPVIIMSTTDDETVKISVLDSGADYVLLKPFGIDDLLAHLRKIERPFSDNMLKIGDLIINFEDWKVKLRDKIIKLTRNEFLLLKALAEAQGQLVTYERLLARIWPKEYSLERSKVRGLVMQIRKKLSEDLNNPQYILTEVGVGYRLNIDNSNKR